MSETPPTQELEQRTCVQSIRGMNDVLPAQSGDWQYIEALLRKIAEQYGYQEIRFPVVERTELFKRSIGEVTDIVEKEMYTFEDRRHESLTLRPEGTASCVRACIEHGLLYHQTQRLWYMGPMYRYERPQKNRYRQFHQFSLEAFGMPGAAIDAELIFMTQRLWQALKLEKSVVLHINSLGDTTTRARYREQLINYFSAYKNQLDEDSKRRLLTNPLRILDSKNPQLQSLIHEAPKLIDYLDEPSKEHFLTLQYLLREAGILFTVDHRLVRGLDYYNRTVFEWIMVNDAAAQNTLCGGGRYDGLVEQLGGVPTSAVGLSIGLERLLPLITKNKIEPLPSIYLIMLDASAKRHGMLLAEQIRTTLPNLTLIADCAEASLKSQLKRADKSSAQIALILGKNEVSAGVITIKYLRDNKPQETVALTELTEKITRVY